MSLEELVNQNYKYFSESDRAVWKYLSEHRPECENIAIKKMAQKCCVSHSAVIRFAQKLGFKGFAELKLYLKMDGQKVPVHNELKHICELYQNVMDSICEKTVTGFLKHLMPQNSTISLEKAWYRLPLKKSLNVFL